jgi:UDPglucose--hexose-1-phosphate uridylyltransferase
MKANEIRQNKATKQWVIYASARRKRPGDLFRKSSKKVNLAVSDKTCPFCPGNEHMLPSIILEKYNRDSNQWLTRVVPNKYPALIPEGELSRYSEGIYTAMEGYGLHEVIIESPYHNKQITDMSHEEMSAVVETYHRRYVELMSEHKNMMTIIFRNHGMLAGTSLRHPHSQIIVTGFVPHYIRWREEEAQQYHDEWGRCVYCDMLDFEMKEQRRVILGNDSFLAFVPFAAEVPFEIWIMPKRHEADFGSVSDEEKEDLSFVLRDCLSRLNKKLHDPDYNYVINTAARFRAGEPQLHWYIQIRPRLTNQAGFEIGSGININPSIPENDAGFLREENKQRQA